MNPCLVVVEDEPDILQLLHDLFEVEGFSTIGVAQPQMVLGVAGKTSPDLFLVDIMLPGMSGIEVAEILRANGFASTPMIAMSASRVMVDLAIQSGLFQAVVNKPFDFDLLFEEIYRMIDGQDVVAHSMQPHRQLRPKL